MIPILFDRNGRPFFVRLIRAGREYHEGVHADAEPLVVAYEDMPLLKPREVILASQLAMQVRSFDTIDFDDSALVQVRHWLRYDLFASRIILRKLSEWLGVALGYPDQRRDIISSMRGLDFESPALQRAYGWPAEAHGWLQLYGSELTIRLLLAEGVAPCPC
jgi:hypothetical protein